MMRYKDTDPANLYRDCFGYVVNCTMANCHHLSLEDAEDITSQSFMELYLNGKTNIQNWVWLAKMRGRCDYVKRYTRVDYVGTSADVPDAQVIEPAFFEVFQFSSLLVRKDAKECLGLVLKGYTSNEIAETLHRTKQGVKTMLYRLRKQAKVTLKRDVELYKKRTSQGSRTGRGVKISRATDEKTCRRCRGR